MVQIIIKLDLRRIENSSQFSGSENPEQCNAAYRKGLANG
jgi:hypothetical protein